MQVKKPLIVEPIGLDLETLPRPLNFAELFGNDHPVEFEIGIGKGTFLAEQAKAHPESNFIGVEYVRWYWRYASDRLRRHGCLNVRTFRAEANFFLSECVADASLSVIHVYFPDPWPKKRHHKRRLIQEPFLRQVHRVLKPGGRLQVVTDHADYFAHIEPTMRASPLKVIEYIRPDAAGEGEYVGTNFERKYIQEGRPFNAIAAMKE